jgi:hypothetical protein
MTIGETLHYYKILNYYWGLCQGQLGMLNMATPLTGDSIWLFCFNGWGTVKQFPIQTFNILPNVSIYYWFIFKHNPYKENIFANIHFSSLLIWYVILTNQTLELTTKNVWASHPDYSYFSHAMFHAFAWAVSSALNI